MPRGDSAVGAVAERQHGVVSTAQLHAAGVAQAALRGGSDTDDCIRFTAACMPLATRA